MLTKYDGYSKDEFIREFDWAAASNQKPKEYVVCLPTELVLEAIKRLRECENVNR